MINESPLQDIFLGEITSKWATSNSLYVDYRKSIPSTSDLAKDKAFAEDLLSEGVCLFLTDNQTQGRGRNSNTWISPQPGSALLCSWSYLLEATPQPSFSPMVGLAVYRALSSTWPFLAWSLKAPNDIYLNDKKVAGILLENIIQADETRIIIGLGLNVFSSPKDLLTSTSIASELPAGIPLLGQDYISFLDRLFYELTDSVANCEDTLTPTSQISLKYVLNKNPNLTIKVKSLSADASMTLEDNSLIHWSRL